MPVPEPLPLEFIAFILKYMDIRLPTREDIHLAFEQGEEAMVELVLGISQHVEELAGQLEVQATVLKACRLHTSRQAIEYTDV